MSTARGILNYLDKVDAAEAVEQEKQNTREALAFELQMKYGDNFCIGFIENYLQVSKEEYSDSL